MTFELEQFEHTTKANPDITILRNEQKISLQILDSPIYNTFIVVLSSLCRQ